MSCLQKQYLAGSSSARAILAQLRRAGAGDVGTAWDVSAYLLPECDESPDLAEPTFEETAIHVAMTTYARLQQSNVAQPMHVGGRSLGAAARMLADDHRSTDGGDSAQATNNRDKVWGRLAKIAQAESTASLRWQLRSLASLLKRQDIGLDVSVLADDLYFWQIRSTRPRVQRQWSRDFFSPRTINSHTDHEPNENA